MTELQPIRVGVLRGEDDAPLPIEEGAFARAVAAAIDLPLPATVDPQGALNLARALKASCQALVVSGAAEPLQPALAEGAKRPVVRASDAERVGDAARVLLALAGVEPADEEAGPRVALLGPRAEATRELLVAWGLPTDRLSGPPEPPPVAGSRPARDAGDDDADVTESGDDADATAPPGYAKRPDAPEAGPGGPADEGAEGPTDAAAPASPDDLDLAVADPDWGVPLPDERDGLARLELPAERDDLSLALPFLVRAAADAEAEPDTACLAAAADALVALARPGLPAPEEPGQKAGDAPLVLPLPGSRRLLGALAPAAAAALDAGRFAGPDYRRALLRLRSPLRRALGRALEAARERRPILVLTAGEDGRAIEAARALADEGLATPWLLGDQFRVEARAKAIGVPLKGLRVVDPRRDKRRSAYATALHEALGPVRGLTPERAAELVGHPVAFAALAVRAGDANALVALAADEQEDALGPARPLLPAREGFRHPCGAHVVATPDGALVVADTTASSDPTIEELGDAARQAALAVKGLLGAEPRVALCSFTCFGAARDPSVVRLERARDLVRAVDPDLAVEGPLRAEVALDPERQAERYPFSALGGAANALVVAGRAGASAVVGALERLAGAEVTGPVAWGLEHAAAVAGPDATAEELLLLAAATAAQAAAAPAALPESRRTAKPTGPLRRADAPAQAPGGAGKPAAAERLEPAAAPAKAGAGPQPAAAAKAAAAAEPGEPRARAGAASSPRRPGGAPAQAGAPAKPAAAPTESPKRAAGAGAPAKPAERPAGRLPGAKAEAAAKPPRRPT